LAEEAHQSLDVLGNRSEEELLPHELQSAQAQAAQTDLILESANKASTFFLCRTKLRVIGRDGPATASKQFRWGISP